MRTRPLGSTNRTLPAIGQGTWYQHNDKPDAAIAALRLGMELGMTHIDTAEMYLDGEAERWVGEAIKGRRDEVFLVSKVLPQNASRRGVVAACERSLERLGTGHLDCYLLHWRGRIPIAETIAGFQQLQRQGKIAAWGVSNFDVPDLRETQTAVAAASPPACDQVLYHLRERAIEHAVLPWCEKNGVTVVAYSPFGHDDFPAPNTAGGRVLNRIAEAHHATPRQVALSFLLRHSSVVVIPKSATPEHLQENAGAGDLTLTAIEIEQIDKAFPLGHPPGELPTL